MMTIWCETSCDRSKAMGELGTEQLITYCFGISDSLINLLFILQALCSIVQT